MHAALSRRGIDHVPDLEISPANFSGPDRRADLLHLHWLYPLFRDRPNRRFRPRARAREAVSVVRGLQGAGVPVVWTVHNLAPHDGFRAYERSGYGEIYRSVDLRVFHSEEARHEAARRFGGHDPGSIVMHHGNFEAALPSPADPGQTRLELGIEEGQRLVLCFGLIRAYKGFDVAIRAMRRLGDAYRLVVAGRPVDRSGRACERLARGLANVDVLPSMLSDQRLADLLEAADAVCLPYRSITGSGVLLQALTAGCGVVVSDLPYFREILQREPEAAVFTPPGDEAALARAIREFFAVPREDRQNAALRLAERYDWNRCVAPLAEWVLEHAGATARR